MPSRFDLGGGVGQLAWTRAGWDDGYAGVGSQVKERWWHAAVAAAEESRIYDIETQAE